MIKQDIRWWQIIVICILIAGVILTVWSAQQQDETMRNDLLVKTNIAKTGVSTEYFKVLKGSSADIISPEYQALKAQLKNIRAADPDIRFAYIVGQTKDGKVIFYADSEPPESADYSPPGQVYTEAPAAIRSAFATGEMANEGPFTDRWGTWESGFIPVTDPSTGKVIAVFGMDIDARDWNSLIFSGSLPLLIATLLIVLLVLVSAFFQRRSEEEKLRLKISEETFSEAFHANPALTAISTLEEGRLLDVNLSFLATLGYTRKEVIGRTVSDLGLYFDPAQRNALLRQIRETGKASNIDVKIYRKNRDLLDGSLSAIIIDADGNPRLFTVILDLTERKRAEKQITESNEFLQTLIQTIPYPVFYKNRDGRYQECNKAFEKYFGLPAEEIIGKTVFEIFPKEIAEEYFRIDEELFSHPGMKQYNARVVTNDGLTRYAIFDKATIVNSTGDVTGLVGIISDITERKKAEDALRESEEKYRSIFNNFPDLYYQTDLDGIITVLSPSVKKLSGWAPEELIGHPVTELYPFPEERGGLMETLSRTGAVQDYEITLLHKDGTHIRTSISCRLVLDNSGRPSDIEGTIRNITERKVFEETLKESEGKLQMALYGSETGMWELDIPTMTRTIDDRTAQILGYPQNDIGHRNADWDALSHPEDLFLVHQRIADCLEGRTAFFEAEYRMRHASGEWIWVISKGKITHRLQDGSPLRITGTLQNCTERKQMEEALQGSEEKYRGLTENTPDLLFSADMDGIITYISPQINQYGYLEKDLIGHLFFDFIHPEDRQAIIETITTELKKNYRFNATFRMLDNWQDSHWFEENSILRLDPFGKPIGIYGILRDITERKRAEQAIMEGTKKLNILNSITRHDILNQITALGMLLNMLGERVPDNAAQVYVAKSQEVTERITRQIEFTKEYQDIGVLSPRWQNVFDLVSASKKLLIPCPFDISIETGTLEIYADPLLAKVFYNLLENSMRHGEKVTRVRIITRESENGLTLIYEDNGAGIDEKSKKNLFKRGFGKHTGFGLYMMREILAITGILIEETGEPGKGARFEIFVPNGSYRQSGPA